MDDVFRVRTAKDYDIEITDDDLRAYGIEPEKTKTLNEEFDEIMRDEPNLVEKTLSDALLEELEAEIKAEEAEKAEKGNETEVDTEDEWEVIENKNIPSVKNKKSKLFGLFGGSKLDEIPTKTLLLQFGKTIHERNFYSQQLKTFTDKKSQIMNNDSLSAEKKKERILSILRAWITAHKGIKPTDYAEKIKVVNNRINSLKKYLKDKRGVNADDLDSIENGWETLQEEEIEEAKKASSNAESKPSAQKPKKFFGLFGGKKTRKGKGKHSKKSRKHRQTKKGKHSKKTKSKSKTMKSRKHNKKSGKSGKQTRKNRK